MENNEFNNNSYKTSFGPKPLRIRFDKIDVFIITYDGTIIKYNCNYNYSL